VGFSIGGRIAAYLARLGSVQEIGNPLAAYLARLGSVQEIGNPLDHLAKPFYNLRNLRTPYSGLCHDVE
jgi:hypothetical protein